MARCVLVGMFVLFVATAPAAAQDIRGKTILFSYSGGNGQIYVAPSGNVYQSYESPRGGFEYKLGRTVTRKGACQSQNSAFLAGSTLTLTSVMTCPAQQARYLDRVTVTLTGDGCRLHVHNGVSNPQNPNFGTGGDADTCEIRQGNLLAR